MRGLQLEVRRSVPCFLQNGSPGYYTPAGSGVHPLTLHAEGCHDTARLSDSVPVQRFNSNIIVLLLTF